MVEDIPKKGFQIFVQVELKHELDAKTLLLIALKNFLSSTSFVSVVNLENIDQYIHVWCI